MLTLDETTVRFKGRSTYKTVIKGKPTPIGYKLYTIASLGYLLTFSLYRGKGGYAVKQGVIHHTGSDDGTAAFFQRLQLDELGVQSAMLVLRQCGVPKMNYTLRCMPPPCIEQLATSFDTHVMHAAQRKLLLHPDEAKRRPTVERLRAPLRHGGFGLASARQTSPAAYLGSLAAVACAPTFAAYSNPDSPLPSSTQLYDWIASSIAALVDAAPECEALLPPSPSVFFQHETILTTSPHQHELSQQATNSFHKAYLCSARRTRRRRTTDGL